MFVRYDRPLYIPYPNPGFVVRSIYGSLLSLILPFLSVGCTTVAPSSFVDPIIRITFPAWITEEVKLKALRKESLSRANLLCASRGFKLEQVRSTPYKFGGGVSEINGFIRCKEKASDLSNEPNSAVQGVSGKLGPLEKKASDHPYLEEERMRPMRP